MKTNHSLLIISMVIISLLAIGSVSASENVTDVIGASDSGDIVAIESDLEDVASASENVTDVIGASDSGDIVAIESDLEDVVAVENDFGDVMATESGLGDVVAVENNLQNLDILSKEIEKESIAVNVAENEIIKDNSSSGGFDWSTLFGGNGTFNWSSLFGGNGTSFDWASLFGLNSTGNGTFNWSSLFGGNGTSFDWSTLFGGNGTSFDWSSLFGGNGTAAGNNSSFDWGSLFGGNDTSKGSGISGIIDLLFGKKDSINSVDLTTYYDKTTKFKVTVMNGNETLTKGNVVFTINNKYVGDIGKNGVAVLNIKLKPGTYYVTSAYGQVLVQNKIVIKKSIFTKNVVKKYKKAGKFNVKVLNTKGKPHAKQTVKITLKGKTYTAKTNSKGIATFKLPKSLKVGKYTIKTTCKGLTISNKLTVKK